MDAGGWVAVGTLFAATVLFVLEAIPLAFVALSIPVVLVVTRHRQPRRGIVRIR